jgi:hypothetical protein
MKHANESFLALYALNQRRAAAESTAILADDTCATITLRDLCDARRRRQSGRGRSAFAFGTADLQGPPDPNQLPAIPLPDRDDDSLHLVALGDSIGLSARR